MSKSAYTIYISTELKNKFKAKCASQGKTMLEVIIDLITKYVSK